MHEKLLYLHGVKLSEKGKQGKKNVWKEEEEEKKKVFLENFLFFCKTNRKMSLEFSFPLGFTQKFFFNWFLILLSLTHTTIPFFHVSSQLENKMKELRLSWQNSFQVKVNIFLLGSFLYHKKTHYQMLSTIMFIPPDRTSLQINAYIFLPFSA